MTLNFNVTFKGAHFNNFNNAKVLSWVLLSIWHSSHIFSLVTYNFHCNLTYPTLFVHTVLTLKKYIRFRGFLLLANVSLWRFDIPELGFYELHVNAPSADAVPSDVSIAHRRLEYLLSYRPPAASPSCPSRVLSSCSGRKPRENRVKSWI